MAVSGRKSLVLNAVKSPSSSQQGNLTGHRRVLSDHVVDLYNSIEKWKNLYEKGTRILESLQATGDSSSFQACCETLGDTIELMYQETTTMNEYVNKFVSLSKLHNTDLPVFVCWSHQSFGNESFR